MEIRKSDIHGKGVFADKPYVNDEVVCVADVLIINNDVSDDLQKYCFPWSSKDGLCCIVLGKPTFMNSSKEPNCKIVSVDKVNMTKTFITTRHIAVGDELLLCYMKDHLKDMV